MRITALILLFSLVGCGSALTGQWEGKCVTLEGTQQIEYQIELDISEVTGGDVDGDAEVVDIDAENQLREGGLNGTQDGKDVTLTIDLAEGEFLLDGEVDGSSMTGDCEWRTGHAGDFELDKVE